jgi:glycogen(starch) synthase
MRVLMISWEYPPYIVGGLGRHVFHISKSLVQKGIDVTVLTFNDGSSPAQEEVNGVQVVRINPYSLRYPDFISWSHGLNMLMIEAASAIDDFDVIHVHDWLTAYAGIALKHIKRKPLVATIHSTELGRRGSLRNDYERHIHELEWWLTYEAWNVICCSNYMLREVSGNMGCPREKMSVITNGYEGGSMGSPASLVRENYAQNGQKLVIYVGRLVYEKGPHILLEAASKLKHLDLKYLIVGDGSMKPYLVDLSRKLGISERVYFLGHISDSELATFYQWSSAAVFPSLYEPFGIVALEAMGAGIPVVVSATGGLDEIVQDGYNGLKFMPGSSDSLTYQLNRVITDKALSDWLVGNARQSIEKYSWDSAATETVAVYRKVLDQYEKGSWKPAV